MAEFKGISFAERGDDARFYPTWESDTEVSVRKVPGGNKTVVQSGGQAAETLTLNIRCTKSQLDSLRAARGSSGSLTFSYGTATVFLRSVTNAREIIKSGSYFATLTFIRV